MSTITVDSDLDKRQNWELILEGERIIKTFDQTIENLQTCLCLPILLQKYQFILKSRLTADQYQAVDKLREYLTETELSNDSINSKDRSLTASITSETEIVKKQTKEIKTTAQTQYPILYDNISFDKCDANFERAMEYLTKFRSLTQFCEKIIHKITPEGKLLLSRLRMLRQRMMNRLMMNPVNQYKKECALRECYVNNEILKEKIASLQEELFKAQEDHKKMIEQKQEIINIYEVKLIEIKKKFSENFILRINKNESTMVNKAKEAEALQDNLRQIIQSLASTNRITLETNLKDEKKLEVRRHKAEAQVIALIAKFDNDMFDRQDELDRIEKDVSDQRNEYNKLKEKFDEQEEDYVRLMKDKAEEDERLHQEKIKEFTFNYAAKQIQRTWRAHWARKMARRKARKKKKKL